VVRWVDRLGRDYENVCDTIKGRPSVMVLMRMKVASRQLTVQS
jgi:hypothetical protein